MKEDWTKQMKQKLEGHEMTPPAGLWEDISQQMGLEPKPAPKVTFMRRYYWVAAAVVLALVGFFAFYQFDENQSQPQLTAHNKPATATQTDDIAKTADVDLAADAAQPSAIAKQPRLLAHTPITPKQDMNKAETVTAETQQETAEVSQEVAVPSQEMAETSQEPSNDSPMVAASHPKQTYLPDISEPYTTSSKSDDSDRWTIGLSGSNGLLLAANNSLQTQENVPLYNDFYSDPATYLNAINKYYATNEIKTVPDVVYKHHIPVRFGLSLQYQLSDRLSLLSGISYTYLKSDISSQLLGSQSIKQTLSYFGIPVGLSWKVWSSQNFHVYLTGSTLIEKCIDANVSDGDINERPWQWSVNASAGAEYNITRQFGLYLEPSLGYYFNDGSSLQHYYKEHPLAPSIQFGLRLHLK